MSYLDDAYDPGPDEALVATPRADRCPPGDALARPLQRDGPPRSLGRPGVIDASRPRDGRGGLGVAALARRSGGRTSAGQAGASAGTRSPSSPSPGERPSPPAAWKGRSCRASPSPARHRCRTSRGSRACIMRQSRARQVRLGPGLVGDHVPLRPRYRGPNAPVCPQIREACGDAIRLIDFGVVVSTTHPHSIKSRASDRHRLAGIGVPALHTRAPRRAVFDPPARAWLRPPPARKGDRRNLRRAGALGTRSTVFISYACLDCTGTPAVAPARLSPRSGRPAPRHREGTAPATSLSGPTELSISSCAVIGRPASRIPPRRRRAIARGRRDDPGVRDPTAEG